MILSLYLKYKLILITAFMIIFIRCIDRKHINPYDPETQNNEIEQKIFFTKINSYSDLKIYSILSDGSNEQLIINEGYIASSPQAGKIACCGWLGEQEESRIFISNTSGENIVQIDQSSNYGSHIIDPILSPNGDKLLYMVHNVDDMDMYIANTDGSNKTRLTDMAAHETIPAFSPDGEQIAFWGNDDRLYLASINGRLQYTNANNSVGAIDGFPTLDWSPDGNKIVYWGKTKSEELDIFILDINTGNSVNLTSDNRNNGIPVWSPNGQKIAFIKYIYVDNYTYYSDIWIMNSDGTEKENLTNTPTDADIFPQWSSDSKKIVYTSEIIENGIGTLKVIDVNTLSVKVLESNAYKGFWEY